MFDRAKRLYELQKQAKDLRKQLQAHTYSAELPSGDVKVLVNGEQDVTEITINLTDKYRNVPQLLATDLKDVLNKAMAKSKKSSAELMRGAMGDFGMPGM